MKCDGLEKFDATSNAERSAGIESRYAYDANEVDAAIAELKAENESLRKAVSNWHDKYCNLQETIDRLECKLECVKENKDKELRATNRALWLARAWGANQRTKYLDLFLTGRVHAIRKYKWIKITSECRAKAEEYK